LLIGESLFDFSGTGTGTFTGTGLASSKTLKFAKNSEKAGEKVKMSRISGWHNYSFDKSVERFRIFLPT
jgi:hypothetical protein